MSASTPNEVTMKPPLQLKPVAIPVQTSQTSRDHNQTGSRRQTLNSRYHSSMPQQSKGSTSQTRRRKTANKHDQMMMRPVFLDDDMPCDRTRTRKMSNAGSWKKLMPRKEESEDDENSLSPRSSTVWSSTQNESSARCRSNYSEETWSPSNDDFSETESNSQESLTSSYQSSNDDRRRMTDSVESDCSNEKYPEKTIGRFKRMKNKLGLIFHYHHHHHHHHHHHDHGNNRSTWKRVQKMFHRKDKRRKNDHGQARGDKKSLAVKNMSKKNQGDGNFQALLKGLVRHTKNSKKTRKGGIRRPHQVPGLGKKTVNKLHWWQTYRRGGVKLPKRGPVKVPKLPMKR